GRTLQSEEHAQRLGQGGSRRGVPPHSPKCDQPNAAAQDHSSEERRSLDRREVLARIELARERKLRLTLRVPAALARMVDDLQLRQMPYAPPGLPDSSGEVDFLGVEEEALVHETAGLQRLATDDHEQAGRPGGAEP